MKWPSIGNEPVAAISKWRDDQSQCVAKILITVSQFRVDHSHLQLSILAVTITARLYDYHVEITETEKIGTLKRLLQLKHNNAKQIQNKSKTMCCFRRSYM